MKVLVICCQKGEFPNKETGEIISFTKTTLGIPTDPTDDFAGYLVEDITGKIEDFSIIKNFVNKVVDVEFEFRKSGKKSYSKKFSKVGDYVL